MRQFDYFLMNCMIFIIIVGPIYSQTTHSSLGPAIINISYSFNKDMNELWDKYNGSEFLICADKHNGMLMNVYESELIVSDPMQVRSNHYCRDDTVLEMHSHPNGYCHPSEYDIEKILNNTRDSTQPHIQYYGIMCAKSKYLIYSVDNLNKTDLIYSKW